MGVMETPQEARISGKVGRFVERPPEVEAVQCPDGPLEETISEWQRLAGEAGGMVLVGPKMPSLQLKSPDGEESPRTAWPGDWLVWRLGVTGRRMRVVPEVWTHEAFCARFEESLFERNRRAFAAELGEWGRRG